jgi:hypothetical protein
MQKILFSLAIILLVAAGCNSETNPQSKQNEKSAEQQTSSENKAEAQTEIKSEQSLTFTGKRPTGSNADLYKGYIIVEGEFAKTPENPVTLGSGLLSFKPDSQYASKMPEKFDGRSEWFAFDNQKEAEAMLGVSPTCPSGKAKIGIRDYTVELLESAVWDHTTLEAVISSTCKN